MMLLISCQDPIILVLTKEKNKKKKSIAALSMLSSFVALLLSY